MSISIECCGHSYAVDILTALAVTRVTETGTGHDADSADLPDDLADRIADHHAETWAAECETQLTPAERHLARWLTRALLPDPYGDERDLEEVLRLKWTGPGRRAA